VSKKVVASIEARMNASRLPGKVLEQLGDMPALSQMLSRVRQSSMIDDIVVATTDTAADDRIAGWAEQEGVACFRGSENDVLDRVVNSHKMMSSSIIVELCGDCPLIEPAVIDLAVQAFLNTDTNIVSTVIRPEFPSGVDVEVFTLTNLEWIAANISDPLVREHVSSYFYQQSKSYSCTALEAPHAFLCTRSADFIGLSRGSIFLRAVLMPSKRESKPILTWLTFCHF
jgi:spore coat polysaccharide biosynthesis protein SpsF